MPNHCLTDRATALVNAVSKERHQNLSAAIQQIGAAMNARGVFLSSMHVNEISQACVSELRNIAGLVWDNMKRAHESCGSKTSEDLLALFRILLLAQRTKMEQVQEGAIGGIAEKMQNQTLLSTRELSVAYDDLLNKYQIEIDIYISNLQQGAGTTLADRLRRTFMNNWAIATVVTVVAAIVFLAAFTEAISKLSGFAKGVFGEG